MQFDQFVHNIWSSESMDVYYLLDPHLHRWDIYRHHKHADLYINAGRIGRMHHNMTMKLKSIRTYGEKGPKE